MNAPVGQLELDAVAARDCKHCGESLTPRAGGGKGQKYCKPSCRQAHHADAQRSQRQEIEAPTLGTNEVEPQRLVMNRDGVVLDPFTTPAAKAMFGKDGVQSLITDIACASVSAELAHRVQAAIDRAVLDAVAPKRAEPSSDSDFDSGTKNCVLFEEQRAVAVYENEKSGFVTREERAWDEEDDRWIVITRPNLQALIDRLCDLAGIGGAGRRD